jgi:HEPN domain-containing protein
MQPDRRILAREWRSAAAEDLRVAKLLRDESPSTAAFHSQQSVEKALTAACIVAIDEAPRTHVVNHLLDELAANGHEPTQGVREAARILERFYAPTRYPDALGGIDPNKVYVANDASQAITEAEIVIAFADVIVAII